MAIPVTTYSELLSTTLRDISKTAIDQVSRQNAAFELFKKNARSQAGGSEMVVPVILGEEVAPSFTDESGTFTAAVSADIVGSAVYAFDDFEIAQVRLQRKTLELNSGKNQLIDLLRLHRDAAIRAFQKSIASNLHALDGARAAGSYLSLDSLCNAAVTTVGGINSATAGNAAWTPTTQDATDETDIKVIFRTLFDAMKIAGDGQRPDVAIVGKNAWDMLRLYLDDHSSITTGIGGGGSREFEWDSCTFEGAEIRWDFDCPDDRIYALSADALEFRYLNDMLLKVEEPQRVQKIDGGVLKNTLDMTYPIVNMLSVGTNERRRLGLVTGVGTVTP